MSKPLGSKGIRDEPTDSSKFLSTDSLDMKQPEDCKLSESVISGDISMHYIFPIFHWAWLTLSANHFLCTLCSACLIA